MFVGNSRMGKTTLTARLMKPKDYKKTKIEERTINVNIQSWGVDLKEKREGLDVDKIIFSLWDFAGQTERYHATHELYFDEGSLYVIVWDMGACCEATYVSQTVSPSSAPTHVLTGGNDIQDFFENSTGDEEDDDNEIFNPPPPPTLNKHNTNERTARVKLETIIDEVSNKQQ